MTLNHIHLGTKNLAKSVEFYSKIFGFKKKYDYGQGIFIENKAGFLIAIDPVDDLPDPPSWFHLGFCLKTEQEVLSLYEKCKSLKTQFVRELSHQPKQYASFYICDPDKNKIEISWHLE